ncbi:MAG: corA 2 [Solirubrobacterales bacterium]|nr:corA 2 [Solirubrobacterales bacterium]
MPLQHAVVDCAYYEDGCRKGGVLDVDEAFLAVESAGEDGFVWIGLHNPAPEVVEAIGERFGLPPLAVEDAVHAHQRPKLEVFDDILFMVFKTARYVDAEELVEIGELMLFKGPGFVVTVRHGEASPLAGLRTDLEAHPDLLHIGPSAVLYAVADRIVDDYAVVLDGLAVDVDEIEAEVFSGGTGTPAERIYRLKREVLAFKRAIDPLAEPLERLSQGSVGPLDPRTAEYFSDVLDHLLRDAEQVAGLSELLTNVLNANIAQINTRDNQDMRKISAWLAIISVPTMVVGVYGMNFDAMPELRWEAGFPLVITLVLAVCGALYGRFKRAGWL